MRSPASIVLSIAAAFIGVACHSAVPESALRGTELETSRPAASSLEEPPDEVADEPAAELDPAEFSDWIRSPAGHQDADVVRCEPVPFVPHIEGRTSNLVRVVAEDAGSSVDVLERSWGLRADGAVTAWRMADALAAVRDGRIEFLRRATGGATFSGSAGETVLCPAPSGRCFDVPTPDRVAAFDCDDGRTRRCSLDVVQGEYFERWAIEGRGTRARRRVSRTWRVEPDAIAPAATRPRPDEAWGPWTPLTTREERPDYLDRAPFGRLDVEDAESPCEIVVGSIRGDGVVVTSVSCESTEPLTGERSSEYVAFAVSDASGMTVSSILRMGAPTPEPVRLVDVSTFAEGAIGFETSSYGGGSPGGYEDSLLWLAVPESRGRARLFDFEIGDATTVGLGAGSASEGYVVGYSAYRARLEFRGSNVGTIVRCDRWVGTHARLSDHWSGSAETIPLDLRVELDPARGFSLSAEDFESFRRRCRRSEEDVDDVDSGDEAAEGDDPPPL